MNIAGGEARAARLLTYAGLLCGWALCGASPAAWAPVMAETKHYSAVPTGIEHNSYQGSLSAGGPGFSRPLLDCSASAALPDTPYHLQPFTVAADGTYVIASAQDYDGFVIVYEEGFDPRDPDVDCLQANDDADDAQHSALSVVLTAGTQYLLVTTASSAADIGSFANDIQGPGAIVFGARYDATTANGATYKLPREDCAAQTNMSVQYHAQPFVVDADGDYRFTSVQPDFDGFLVLYAGSFNRSRPLDGCEIGNDDGFNYNGTSAFTATLNRATQYVLVTTSYGGGQAGAFTNTVAGPGHVSLGGVNIAGSTVGAPTYQRALADCSALSNIGTDVGYRTQTYFGDVDGTYRVGSAQDYDGYLSLYDYAFDPAGALDGCLGGNDDDYPGTGTSAFAYADAGPFTRHQLVTTGYQNSDAGQYIDQVTPPPEGRVALYNDTADYSGTTTGAPTFNRPAYTDCSSLTRVTAAYSAQEFSVSVSGNYMFFGAQEEGWDGYLLLYEAPFAPADGTSNCLGGSDDGPDGAGTSQFIHAPLKAFRRYVLVTTGFDAGAAGNFENHIFGPSRAVFGNDRIFGDGFD